LLHDIKKKNYLDLLEIRDKVNLVTGSITDIQLLQRIFVDYKPIDAVFHLAAVSIVGKAVLYPLHTYQTNVFGTLALLEACRLAEDTPEAIICTSSDKIYGNRINAKEEDPLNGLGIYDSSKVNMDVVSRSYYYVYSLPVVVSRSCNIIGADILNKRIVPSTILSCLKNESPVVFTNIKGIREYIYVDDVVDAYVSLAKNIDVTKGKAYNIGTGHIISQSDLVKKIAAHFNIEPRYINAEESRVKEIAEQSISSERIHSDIGWYHKVDLDMAIKNSILGIERIMSEM